MIVEISSGERHRLYNAITILILGAVVTFLIKLYMARLKMIKLQRRGLRMPPHHPLFGHLLVAQDVMSKLPSNAHPQYLPGEIQRKFPDVGPVFYLDMWPFSLPLLVVASPSAAYQLTQEHSQPKAAGLRNYMRPLTGNNDLVTMEGQLWKDWRNIFNPGFSASHLMTLVPEILLEISTFSEILHDLARKGEMFSLEEVLVNVTMDTIGRVTLDTHFNAQRSKNELVAALRKQILWLTFGADANPFKRWNPFRPLAHWYYNRRVDRYISRELENRFAVQQGLGGIKGGERRKSKTIVDLALNKYLDEQGGPEVHSNMDTTFKKFAISQIKVFILAGHDTTSSTLCHIYYLLSVTPTALRRIRAEHDNAFGTDPGEAQSVITSNPHVLNQLPYTLAVIKEALRLFPAGSSTRQGDPGFALTEDGQQYPTEDCIVWSLHQLIHRESRYWPQPDTFLPERWLVSIDDPLHPVKGAWRPFEFGPRNCIGQELALLETKLVLAMTIREFDITTAFAEWEQLNGRTGPRTVNGEVAYQSLEGTNRPRDGFPSRVKATVR